MRLSNSHYSLKKKKLFGNLGKYSSWMLLIPGEEAQGILGWCSGRRPKIRTSWPPLGRSSQPSPHIHTALFPPTSSSLAQIRNTQIHSFRMEIRKMQLLPLWKLSTDWRPVAAGGVVPVLPLRATRTCWGVSWSGALQEIRISFIWSAGKYRKYLLLVFGLLEKIKSEFFAVSFSAHFFIIVIVN